MKKVIKIRLVAVSGSKILVLKKKAPVVRYTLPGGTKKRKESEVQTLIRETFEEVGMALSEDQVHYYLAFVRRGGFEIVDKHYFYMLSEPLNLEVREKHKFDQVAWLDWTWVINFMDKADRLAVKTYYDKFGERTKVRRALLRPTSPLDAMVQERDPLKKPLP